MRSLIFTIIFFVFLSQAVFAQSENTIDKTTFIKAVNILERDPFIKDGKKHRQTLTLYLIETKDVSVSICSIPITEPVFNKKYKFSSELFSQSMFGMAVYKLENPEKADDETAAQVAGVESMLRAYENMVLKNGKAKYAAADQLIASRDDGTLQKLISEAYVENCTKK